MPPGKLTLLGASPGEPRPPTIRAAKELAFAAIVLPDDLFDPEITTAPGFSKTAA
jgi:siroheme synthase